MPRQKGGRPQDRDRTSVARRDGGDVEMDGEAIGHGHLDPDEQSAGAAPARINRADRIELVAIVRTAPLKS